MAAKLFARPCSGRAQICTCLSSQANKECSKKLPPMLGALMMALMMKNLHIGLEAARGRSSQAQCSDNYVPMLARFGFVLNNSKYHRPRRCRPREAEPRQLSWPIAMNKTIALEATFVFQSNLIPSAGAPKDELLLLGASTTDRQLDKFGVSRRIRRGGRPIVGVARGAPAQAGT